MVNAGLPSLKQLHFTEISSGTLAKLSQGLFCTISALSAFYTSLVSEWNNGVLPAAWLHNASLRTEISWYLFQEVTVTEADESLSIIIVLSPLLPLGKLRRVNFKFGQWSIQSELSDAFYETLAKYGPI